MQMSAGEWVVDRLDGELLCEPATHLYFWDRATDWTFVCSIPSSAFESLAMEASRFSEADINATRYGLSKAIKALANGETLPKVAGFDTQEQLAISASAYMGTTKVWLAADRMKSQESAIILNYRNCRNADEGLLRPVVAPTSQIIPTLSLMEAVAGVVRQDQARHPEWFSKPGGLRS